MTSVRPVERGGPRRRPPLAIRAFIGLLALGAGLFNAGLMLSDRAPAVTRALFGDFAVRMSARLDATRRVEEATDGRMPGSDAIVHIGVWAVAMTLVGLAVWRWWALVVAAVATFALSVLVELGQGRFSDSRAVERSDVVANGVGVALGVVACAACYLAWSGASALLSAIGGRSTPR